MIELRPITKNDNMEMAYIVRHNLEHFGLDIPGTAYYDPELDSLSDYYDANPEKRAYYVAVNENKKIIGGVGVAEFSGFEKCAELQKLYLADCEKGKGYGNLLIEKALEIATSFEYSKIYLETHSKLVSALALYKKFGFVEIEKPSFVLHGTMNLFYIKELKHVIHRG